MIINKADQPWHVLDTQSKINYLIVNIKIPPIYQLDVTL